MYYNQFFWIENLFYISPRWVGKILQQNSCKNYWIWSKGSWVEWYRNITARFFEKGHNKVGSIDTVDKIYKFKFMFKAWSTGRLAVITGGRIWLINVHTGVFLWAAGWGADTFIENTYACKMYIYTCCSCI